MQLATANARRATPRPHTRRASKRLHALRATSPSQPRFHPGIHNARRATPTPLTRRANKRLHARRVTSPKQPRFHPAMRNARRAISRMRQRQLRRARHAIKARRRRSTPGSAARPATVRTGRKASQSHPRARAVMSLARALSPERHHRSSMRCKGTETARSATRLTRLVRQMIGRRASRVIRPSAITNPALLGARRAIRSSELRDVRASLIPPACMLRST